MNEIYNLLNAENVVTVYENDTNRKPYVGEIFFPNERQRGLKFEFVKGKQGVPVALVSANFNTNVLYRDGKDFQLLAGTLPLFKEATQIDEVLRQEIIFSKDKFVEPLLKKALEQEVELLDGAEATAEAMRMQLLSQGTIGIAENGVNKQYDYGFNNGTQLVTEDVKWNAEGAKPMKSLVARLSAYEDLTHNKASVVVISRKLFRQTIATDTDLAKYFAEANNPFPTIEDYKTLIENKLGITIILTDKKYRKARDFDGNPVPFYPEDRYTILSTLDLGKTLYGTTPEEASKLAGFSQALDVVVSQNGVAVSTWSEADAVVDNIKVSEVVIPTCPNIDQIYIVKVL